MQIVLSRLRAIELEVMSRLPEDGSEHVGSIRLVNHGGKRAMPSFEPPHKGRDTEAENEAADAKMEEDALVALAGLNIDGTGASGVDGKQTWRTAQWIERDSVISQYTMASEMRGKLLIAGGKDCVIQLTSSGSSTPSSFLGNLLLTRKQEHRLFSRNGYTQQASRDRFCPE